MMSEAVSSFRDFEHRGWSTEEVTAGYHECFSGVTMQTIEALLDATGVEHGSRVVDVATGQGYVAAAAAKRGATVVGVDFSATQIALARQRYPTIEFREGDASALPFADGSFDAVVSNFGMPHFPDPDAFLREAFRVLRSGSRIAFSAWAPPHECVGFDIIYSAVQTHGCMDVSLPPGPNFFLFGDPAQCERSLHAAGFQSATVGKVSQVWRVTSPDAPFEAVMKGSVRASALLRAQTPKVLALIRDAIRKSASAYARAGAIELMMPAVVAAAERP
jgi:SAM-dependent methyltransferase